MWNKGRVMEISTSAFSLVVVICFSLIVFLSTCLVVMQFNESPGLLESSKSIIFFIIENNTRAIHALSVC